MRAAGKTELRWEDNVKMDVREVGWDSVNWINVAQFRV
jgi:hypothetical protein